METDTQMHAEETGRWRSASEPVRKNSGKEHLDREVNPVLLRFISSAHLFDGSVVNPPEESKALSKQPASPTLLKQSSLTKLQVSPSFKPKVGLERSLSSNLSLKKPIKLMPKPAPLPDVVSPAQLVRSESDSPAFVFTSQPSPFLPNPEQPTRQDSSGSEALSIGGQSLGSSDSGGLRSMGSLNVFRNTGEPGMHSEYSANEGPSGYGGDGRGGANLSNSGSGGLVQLASAHPVLAPRLPKFFGRAQPTPSRGQAAVSSQVHPMSLSEGPILTKTVQVKPSFGSSLKKMVFKSSKKSGEFVRDPELGVVPAAPATASATGEVWSDVHIQENAALPSGWRKPFADSNYVPQWSAISTDELISQPAPPRIGTILCYLVRNRDKKHPTFWMYTQENTVADRLLLVARFNSRGPMAGGEYVVSKSERGLQTKDQRDGYCGRVRSNFSGSRFQFYDHTVSEKQMWTQDSVAHTQGAVSWESTANTLAGGWRKMGVAVKALDEESPAPTSNKVKGDGEPGPWSPRLWDNMERERQCRCLLSKEPEHKIDDKGRESFFLQYGDRCNFPSKRNFQLVSKADPDAVVCLLGKVEQDAFALDYSYPLSAFQAFCVALTSINDKWCFAV
ncbi:hypothetical protein KFL_001670010 [Klebsormidium nitens]|uniref:Tubby C-terminal domain-containing protein n=1 Tax=Klebsormidium nitens TaxID=105231 RepID=A0A1Y1HYZ6_KLENI|nr:hypothetical protein KFL_001670010 [Klebsormidium nitens]|eukprot:GAQ83890.1 hypothetical protein KFL_001670010 [Klebsormidium nitens]